LLDARIKAAIVNIKKLEAQITKLENLFPKKKGTRKSKTKK